MADLQVGGAWEANQDNGYVAHFEIAQDGTQLDGGNRCSHSNGTVRSTAARGHVQNDHFSFTVTWDNRTEGLYEGFIQRVGPDRGLIVGTTKDVLHPGVWAN